MEKSINNIKNNLNMCFAGRKIHDARVGAYVSQIPLEKLPAKKYVVIDTFEKKNIDIDGDSIDDISHGEFISRLIKALNPKAEVVHIDEPKVKNDEFDDKSWIEIVKKIKELKPDGVNRSTGGSIGYSGTSKLLPEPITRENFISRLSGFRQYLQQQDDIVSKFFLFTVTQLEDLTKSGLKVYNSGGNKGIKLFNYECLADGVNIIGSTDARGNLLESSADNARMKFAQGIYGISQVKDQNGNLLGYDISGTGKVSVRPEEVSSGGSYVNPEIQKFAGKYLKDCLISSEDFEVLKAYYDPYSTLSDTIRSRIKEVMERDSLLTMDQLQQIFPHSENLKQYREEGAYKSLFGKVAYDVDSEGKIIYDPSRSRRHDVINVARGASFATPTYMVMKDIEESCQRQ